MRSSGYGGVGMILALTSMLNCMNKINAAENSIIGNHQRMSQLVFGANTANRDIFSKAENAMLLENKLNEFNLTCQQYLYKSYEKMLKDSIEREFSIFNSTPTKNA